jgi:serine/threonine-protein kinase
MELTPGALIAGRYRVERKVGSGGMGEVWAGEHVNIGVRVALKTLLPAAACDQQIVARFRREAYLLGRMRSDRVARVVDFIEDRRFGLVLVMDFVDGEPLARVVESRRLGIEEALDLGVDIVTALCELHRAKVVHRDLKPDNIILEPKQDGRAHAVIVDFGVSRMESTGAEEDSLTGITHADMAVGTIPYMAPEQFVSSRDVNGAADIYAVGAILYRAVAGEHVFGDAEDMDYARRKLTNKAPTLAVPRFDRIARGLQAIIARALERRPQDRFGDAEEMLRELSAVQDVARAMSFDLDATTEQAPPPSSVSSILERVSAPAHAEIVDDPTIEATQRMSRSDVTGEEVLDESTLDSPGQETDRAPGPPSAMPSSLPLSVVVSSSAPPMASSQSGRYVRPTVPSPEMAPPSSRAPDSLVAAPPPPRGVPVAALVIGVVAALLAGTALGFSAHALMAEPARAAPTRR